MTLKQWIKVIDPCIDVVIWGNTTENEPIYEGSLFNIPWIYMDYQIGRPDGNTEEPIYITQKTNEYGVTLPCITINVIE